MGLQFQSVASVSPFFMNDLGIDYTQLGFILGPPVGIIGALPAEVLQPENRSAGMGLFYAFYYGAMTVLTTFTGTP